MHPEARLEHAWGAWEYTGAETCAQARACEKCGLVEQRQGIHRWGAWEYVAEGACDQVRMCQRCGATEHREGVHAWGAWGFVNRCVDRRYCERCRAMEEREEHNFVEETCPNCQGDGRVWEPQAFGGGSDAWIDCEYCHTTGTISRCRTCGEVRG